MPAVQVRLTDVSTASERTDIPGRTLRKYCRTGRIEGAQKIGGSWVLLEGELNKLVEQRETKKTA